MTNTTRRRHTARAVAALAVLALVAAACGSDDDSSDAATTDAAAATTAAATDTAPADTEAPTDTAATAETTPVATDDAPEATEAPVECTGEPVKFTAIITGTGALAFPSVARDYQDGVTAAVAGVNAECATGRPLEVTVCDDKSDPNESTACGRTAAEDGSLAIVVSSGNFTGAEASGLPSVLGGGANQFDLTSPLSYPSSNAVTQIIGSVSAAAGAGATSYLMVAVDNPQTRFLVDLVSGYGEPLGVAVEGLFFPPETTDYAPIAAQVTSRNPDSIGMIVPSLVPFINAMDAEGISPQDIPMFTSVNLAPPEVIAELGDKIDGVYLIAQSIPPQQVGNAGIDQMLAEFEAAGIDTPVDDVGSFAVDAWSKIHSVADAIAALNPEEIAALDSDTLVAAAVALGAVERPEVAPFDLSTSAFADNEMLAPFRLFTREALAIRIEDGKYVPVTEFGDVTKPFTLETSD
jgi:Periplasmic binding protein